MTYNDIITKIEKNPIDSAREISNLKWKLYKMEKKSIKILSAYNKSLMELNQILGIDLTSYFSEIMHYLGEYQGILYMPNSLNTNERPIPLKNETDLLVFLGINPSDIKWNNTQKSQIRNAVIRIYKAIVDVIKLNPIA